MAHTQSRNRFTTLAGRAARLPSWLWTPLAAGLIILGVGVLALWFGEPWLFPSLGPTAFLQAQAPGNPNVRIYNIVVGHIMGILAGLLGVFIAGTRLEPAVAVTHVLPPAQMWAAVIALTITLALQAASRAFHPPAAATALLIALGAFHATVRDITIILAGVLLVTLIGEPLRRLRTR